MTAPVGVCVVAGCGRPVYQSRTYCGAHRGRFYRYGDPLASAAPRRRDLAGQRFGTLVVVEYDTSARGWRCRCDCGRRTTVRGSSLTSGGTSTCGDRRRHLAVPSTYSDMHWRLRVLRGPASRHACVRCGRPAAHWAYRHRDARQRLDSPAGLWSTHLDDYDPLCVRCHKRADLVEIRRTRAAAHGAVPLWDDDA